MSDPSRPDLESGAPAEVRHRGIPHGYSLHQPFKDFWPYVSLNIAIAEVLGVFAWFVFATFKTIRLSSADIILAEIFGLVMAIFFVSFASIFLAYLTLSVAGMISAKFNFEYETLVGGCVIGSLVGLLASLPAGPWLGELIPELLTVMVAATTLGQCGGVRGAWKTICYRRSQGEQFVASMQTLRFTVRGMLRLTTIAALLLTALRAVGMLTFAWMVHFGTWLVISVLGMVAARAFENRIAKHRST